MVDSDSDPDEFQDLLWQDQDESAFMEQPFFDAGSSSSDDQLAGDILDAEIWDEIDLDDIEGDFPHQQNTGNSLPSINVHVGSRTNVQLIISRLIRCLLVLLAYFWMRFHISDNAMEFLLGALKQCFEVAGMSSQWLFGVAIAFPGTLYYFRKELGFVKDSFVKYVVCTKCHSLYKFDQCYRTVGSSRVPNKCSFVKFPNHRQGWRRQKCGTALLKEVTLKCGSKRLYPHKVYCYKSVIESLTTLVQRTGLTDRCELLRQREVCSISQLMCDVFDGRVWREFQCVDGTPFLSVSRNYGLMLNVD